MQYTESGIVWVKEICHEHLYNSSAITIVIKNMGPSMFAFSVPSLQCHRFTLYLNTEA